ncbi:MAG: hypothetical protein HIU93_12545 [Acidobacteria bacterium]|nr:hypothetical protein [Acidobacteriota bacterium]
MTLPETWISARITDVCDVNPRMQTEIRPDDSTEVTFVPMSAVDETTGVIADPETRTFGEVSKGHTSFRERDVLFAKVTPCMENGKAAIAGSLVNGLGFGSTEFHVLRPTDLILAEYLLYFIRQRIFRSYAASSFVGTGGLQRVPPGFFSRVKIPLPTRPEQQRIIEVIRQAEMLPKLRNDFDANLTTTKHQLFLELFGDPAPKFNEKWPIVQLGKFVDVATGGTPSREQLGSYGGTVPWVKSTDLKDDAILSTDECLSELGIQRSNARVYPKDTVFLAMYGQGQTRGRTGKILIEASCNQACAALLPNDELLPDYLWVWFQLSYHWVRSLGRGGQQENLNLDIIRRIKLPKPPVHLQREFSKRLTALHESLNASRLSRAHVGNCLEVLQIELLRGDATAFWRSHNYETISEAANARDNFLRERGIKIEKSSQDARPTPGPSEIPFRLSRAWLMNELSEFQLGVFYAFIAYVDQPLLAEDPDIFARFCDSAEVAERVEPFGPAQNNRIRRTLSQLSALGLIAKVTLPKQNQETGGREYLKAFRPLREEEFTRLADAAALHNVLGSGGEPQPEIES